MLFSTVSFLDVPLLRDVVAEAMAYALMELDASSIFTRQYYENLEQLPATMNIAIASNILKLSGVTQFLYRKADKKRMRTADGLPNHYYINRKSSEINVLNSDDTKHLAAGYADGAISIWNVKDQQRVHRLKGHKGPVNALSYSPDKRYLASGSDDKTIRIWDLATGKCIKDLQGHAYGIQTISYNYDGSFLASGASDGTIRIWNIEAGKSTLTLAGHKGCITSLIWSPNTIHIVSSSHDKTLRVWNNSTGECIKIIDDCSAGIISLMYNADNYLISLNGDNTLYTWDTIDWNCEKKIHKKWGTLEAVSYDPNYRFLATLADNDCVRIWDLVTWRCIKKIKDNSVTYTNAKKLEVLKRLIQPNNICKKIQGALVWLNNGCALAYASQKNNNLRFLDTFQKSFVEHINQLSAGQALALAIRYKVLKSRKESERQRYNPEQSTLLKYYNQITEDIREHLIISNNI